MGIYNLAMQTTALKPSWQHLFQTDQLGIMRKKKKKIKVNRK